MSNLNSINLSVDGMKAFRIVLDKKISSRFPSCIQPNLGVQALRFVGSQPKGKLPQYCKSQNRALSCPCLRSTAKVSNDQPIIFTQIHRLHYADAGAGPLSHSSMPLEPTLLAAGRVTIFRCVDTCASHMPQSIIVVSESVFQDDELWEETNALWPD